MLYNFPSLPHLFSHNLEDVMLRIGVNLPPGKSLSSGSVLAQTVCSACIELCCEAKKSDQDRSEVFPKFDAYAARPIPRLVRETGQMWRWIIYILYWTMLQKRFWGY